MRSFPSILRPIVAADVIPVRWDPCIDAPGFFMPANDEAYHLFWAMTDTGVITDLRPPRPVSAEEIERWAHQLCIIGD